MSGIAQTTQKTYKTKKNQVRLLSLIMPHEREIGNYVNTPNKLVYLFTFKGATIAVQSEATSLPNAQLDLNPKDVTR
jgi:hypothetical protein